MTLGIRSATGSNQRQEPAMRAGGGTPATDRVLVIVGLFIVLAGIWACLWVPPCRGF